MMTFDEMTYGRIVKWTAQTFTLALISLSLLHIAERDAPWILIVVLLFSAMATWPERGDE